MSKNEPDYRQELINVMDTVSEPILKMSDEEIRQGIIDSGEDPDVVAARVEKRILGAIKRSDTSQTEEEWRAEHSGHGELLKEDCCEQPLPDRKMFRLICPCSKRFIGFEE